MPNIEQYAAAHQRAIEFYQDFANQKAGAEALAKHALWYLDFPSFTTGEERAPTTTTETYVAGVVELFNTSNVPDEVRASVLSALGERVGQPSLAKEPTVVESPAT